MNRLRWVVMFTLVASFLLVSIAEAEVAGLIRFGGRAGLNMAKDSIGELSEHEESKFRPGLQIGGIIEYGINQMFGIESGLLYSMKGGKFEGDYPDYGTGEYTSKLTFLTVPITGKVKLGTPGGPQPFIKAGPEIGFLLSAKEDIKETTSEGTFETEVDFKDHTKSLDLGLNFGGGVEMPIGELQGVAEIGYVLGLTDLSDPQETVTKQDADEPELKTRLLYVSFGVLF